MTSATDRLALVADIGGTNTRVALARGAIVETGTVRRFRNADHDGLAPLLSAYLAGSSEGAGCTAACVAVAGPVRNGRGSLTNLDWTIDEETLSRAAGANDVAILNDLQAQGHALGRLAADAVTPLVSAGDAAAAGDKLVIGVGTGFNAAAVHEEGLPRRLVTPSESGHAGLPVRDERMLRLARFVETAHGFPAIEDVLSGRGLERIHAWLSDEAGTRATHDSRAIIDDLADRSDATATEAVRVFVRLLGEVAGDLALIHLPFGGIYLVGGMARAVAPVAQEFGFAEAFHAKGRFAEFMQAFPVSLVEDDYAALTGCASHLAGRATTA
ncbi:glucokinase [Tranquillimonas rosea]|uniref:glucokinase n=1 Tax=Tranquillimonas rosea TaxID=641238 RepID=UPI003BAC78A9